MTTISDSGISDGPLFTEPAFLRKGLDFAKPYLGGGERGRERGSGVGSNLYLFSTIGCVFVIAVLWVLESFEPPARTKFSLKIAAKDTRGPRPEVEHALHMKGISFDLRGSSQEELQYEVTVPYRQNLRKPTRLIKHLDGHMHGHNGPSVEWEIKKYKTVRPERGGVPCVDSYRS